MYHILSFVPYEAKGKGPDDDPCDEVAQYRP